MRTLITKNNVTLFFKYSIVALKFYRLLCYTTYTFNIIPVVNPYNWPLSWINSLTRPFFKLIKKIFRPVYLGEYGRFDISPFIAFLVLEGIQKELVWYYFLSQKL